MLRTFFLTVSFVLFLLCTSCEPEENAEQSLTSVRRNGAPNIIVIVVDDLRWDELGISGHPFLETPNIDALARDGAQFANAFHSVPLCSPLRELQLLRRLAAPPVRVHRLAVLPAQRQLVRSLRAPASAVRLFPVATTGRPVLSSRLSPVPGDRRP